MHLEHLYNSGCMLYNIFDLLFNKESHNGDLKHKFPFTLYTYGLFIGISNS